MAKAKKGKLTIEDALVPVEEQPYEIPENWCWTYLKAGFDVTSSKRVHKSDWIDEGIPFYRTRELVKLSDNGEVDNELFISEELYNELVEEYGKPALNDILISGVGTIGVPYVVNSNDKFYFKDGNVIWLKNKKLYDAKYIFYLYKSLFMINQIHDMSAGTTVDTYTIVNANSTKVPLPPLEEQKRIVEQIENLFAKLDEAKEKAQDVVDRFEERRVAIIHKAFEGVLTRAWRTANDISYESWQKISLKDCGRWFGGGTPTTSVDAYWENGDIPWITSKDMKDRIIEDSLMHITMTGVENSAANYCDEPAVLFVMRSGILRRVFPVCMVKRPFTVNQDLKACVPNINQEYLYWVCTGYEKDIRENCMKSGTTVESVEAKKLMDYKIPVATPEEQIEVVNQIEKLINKEEAAKEAAESVIESIELMKKSILAKAFRGELGTNIADEESSMELLKSIIET